MSSYYYHSRLRYNIGPLLPLVGDSNPRHNDRANLLFTDGSIRSVAGTYWLQLWLPLVPKTKSVAAPPNPPGAKGAEECD
jgi:prepilin-type processing-associated H-X9-DG protein